MIDNQARFFADVDIFEESINRCACGELIPEEYGYCEDCRDWAVAKKREALYRQRLIDQWE